MILVVLEVDFSGCVPPETGTKQPSLWRETRHMVHTAWRVILFVFDGETAISETWCSLTWHACPASIRDADRRRRCELFVSEMLFILVIIPTWFPSQLPSFGPGPESHESRDSQRDNYAIPILD